MEDTVIPIDDNNTHNGKQEEFTTHNGKKEEFTPHTREQVTMITCSPNMKNIVTWSDVDKSAVCWCVSDNQQKLELKHKISLENNKNYDKYFVYSKYIESEHSKNFDDIRNYLTVSDDKFVSMPIEKVDLEIKNIKINEKDERKVVSEIENKSVIKIGIFNFQTEKNVSLKLPYSEMIIETLAFLNENNPDFLNENKTSNENKLVMISKDPLYRIYIFTRKDDEFIHQSTIKVETYDEKIFLSNGKLFIHDEKLGSITKWDINTSKFEAYFLFNNSFKVDNMKLSFNGVLLFVYGRKHVDNLHKDPYPCISIYSADNGNKFTTYKYHDKTVNIDAVYLIASDIGARLLIVHHNNTSKKKNEKKYKYHICDPFAPEKSEKSYVKADELFNGFEAKCDEVFVNKYIIKNDKIVGFNNDGNLVIKRLIRDNDNWISYLRNDLKDFNSIFISSVSEKIIDLIVKSNEIIEKATTDSDKKMVKSEKTTEEATTDIDKTENEPFVIVNEYSYSKYFVTWTLKYKKYILNNNMYIILTAKLQNDKIEQAETKTDSIAETKTDFIQIVPEIFFNSDKDIESFVNICDCLDNDDLIMVTYWGVLIWTFNTKNYKIELNHCWEDEGDEWIWNRINVIKLFYEIDKEIDEKTFDIKNFDIKKLKKKSYFLPPSSYMNIIHYNPAFSQSKSSEDFRYLFNELIEKHIKDRFFLILYGQKLIEDIIKENEETLLRKLLNGCIEHIEKDEETLNTQIFRIFSQSIHEIFKNNPSFFEDFVIQISLLCILKVDKKDQILKHLNHYQNYSCLSELSYLESLFDTIYISFLYKKFATSDLYIYIINSYPYKKIISIFSIFKPSRIPPQIFLMFPFPNFATYDDEIENDGFLKNLFRPSPSNFINIDNSTFYNTWNGEALINFKWNTFGRKYYLVIWLVYLVFSSSFIIVATLSDYISWPCQKILLIITTVLGFWHLLVEIRNFTFSYKDYFESIWNYLDLGAIISAIVTSIIWLINGSVSTGAITFTTLLLELKFIIYLRFIKYFGIYLAMIMNTADKVVAFLLLFGLIILAFAHSLHLLLRSVIFQDSGVNMFIQFGSSILAAYYMMVTGDSTPVSEWVSNEDIIIMTLMMFFSFFILTYLMNLFIGILGNLLGDNKDNHLAYLTLKKEILEEIELFYLFPSQKRNYKWFPYTFYYSVHISEIRKLISYINSDEWEESAKPITTKIKKAIKDEKQESEFDKIQKMIEKVVEKRDQKQASEAEKIEGMFKQHAEEVNAIKEMFDNFTKKFETTFGKT
ncbi:wd-40 repeat protein [Gigaspora margarita]|uniref:Wd-40 repeat protein n=1 Tax=Gigaspora margarita TaxID=4874 RepID=A0A8H3X871_GIGMA|nr:wd-40 repeat protein [Gigaspora margarita]